MERRIAAERCFTSGRNENDKSLFYTVSVVKYKSCYRRYAANSMLRSIFWRLGVVVDVNMCGKMIYTSETPMLEPGARV